MEKCKTNKISRAIPIVLILAFSIYLVCMYLDYININKHKEIPVSTIILVKGTKLNDIGIRNFTDGDTDDTLSREELKDYKGYTISKTIKPGDSVDETYFKK